MKTVTSLEHRLTNVMEALTEVALSGQYSEGKYVQCAERQLEDMTQRFAVTVNSCGSALYLVYKHLHQLKHRFVAVQNNTFMATAAAAIEAGIKVVLIDSRPDCPSMSLDSLKEAYEVIPFTVVTLTHVGGWMAKDYVEIAQWCNSKEIVLIEDCAHAVGLKDAGSLSYAAVWSFYPTKALPAGEGGAVTTSSKPLAEYVRSFSSYGKYKEEGVIKYKTGLNFRMSEWNAAVLSVQLDHLNEVMQGRRADAAALQSIAPCMLTGESNYYKYPVHRTSYTGTETVGGVYTLSDQLTVALRGYEKEYPLAGVVIKPVRLEYSYIWAVNHVCLPIGENLYSGMQTEEIRNLLGVSDAS